MPAHQHAPTMSRDNGWDASASAWIKAQGEDGDFARRHVLDAPMMALATRTPVQRAVDVGCGEGRFCRKLSAAGIDATGIDLSAELIRVAGARDPGGRYLAGDAASLPFAEGTFDLAVSTVSLCDFGDAAAAIEEMARVLTKGGRIVAANLASHATANPFSRFVETDKGMLFPIDHYLTPRAEWVEWSGIRVQNHHRPLKDYMQAFLGAGLVLTHFDEPAPTGGDPERVARYLRAPWFWLMEWTRPS